MLLEQLSLISIEKLMNYMDLDGFPGCLGQGVGATCDPLWRPVAPESYPL